MIFYNDNIDDEKIAEIKRHLEEKQNQDIQKLYDRGEIIDYKNIKTDIANEKVNKKNNNKKQSKLVNKIVIKTENKGESNKDSDEKIEEKEEDEDIKEFFFRFAENYVQLLFKDQFGKLFAYIKINDTNYDLMSLTSHKFEMYLYKIFYESQYKIILPKELKNNILEHLQYKAEFSGITKKLEARVAKTDDYTFYYDLTNSNWSTVKITSQGWSIENNPPILFRRYSNQLPQVIPVKIWNNNNDEDNILDKFINLLNIKDEDNKLLLKCYIVSLFIPGIAKPILMLHGEQGSAKSTLQELIKMLVDPSIVKTLTFPRDINELIQQLSHNYIAYFDNISIIKEWISDALCRAVNWKWIF